MKTKDEYDVHACLAAAAKPNAGHYPRQFITMKRIQKRGSDKELRRWNGRDKAWIKEWGR